MATKSFLIALIVFVSTRSGEGEVTYSTTSEKQQNNSSIDALVMMRSGKVNAINAAIFLSIPAGVGFNNRHWSCRSEGLAIVSTVCGYIRVGESVLANSMCFTLSVSQKRVGCCLFTFRVWIAVNRSF